MQEAVKTDPALLGQDGLTEALRHRLVCAEYRTDLRQACVIKLLERQGPNDATVSWSDPTAGCYGEQRWRRGVARKSGVCAMTGQIIDKGNVVYRPHRVRPIPRNIEAMILASVMETIPLADVV